MCHFLRLGLAGIEQTDDRVLRDAVGHLALLHPVRRLVPLGSGTGAHQLPAEDGLQDAVGKAPAVVNSGVLAFRIPLTPGTAGGSGAVEVGTGRFDGRMVVRISCPAVCRRTVGPPCAEDIRPALTGLGGLIGDLGQATLLIDGLLVKSV